MSSTEMLAVAPAPAATVEFPFITVIVPTYNRARVLPHLFAALAKQVYPSDRMELIVVDNSSADDTEAVFEQWRSVFPFPAAFYRKENKGPACSRNYGAARARGDVLAFTDSDCIPSPEWLRSAAKAFRAGAGIVCGPFVPVPREDEGVLVAQQSPILYDRGCYPTANLIVSRSAFEAVGGFDERYGLYPWGELIAGEDADLAWRIRRTGARPVFVDGCVVRHLSTPISLRKFLLRPVVVQIIPALLPKIPELRDVYLWHRWFNGKVSLYFQIAWVSVLCAVLTRQWWVALPSLLWAGHITRYVVIPQVRFGGWSRGLRRAVLTTYLQAASSFVLLVASVRYRRLVL